MQHPASFTCRDKLLVYRIVKKEGKFKIVRHKIRQWLQDQDPYRLSRNTVRMFRSRHVVNTIDSLWEIYLYNMYPHICTCIMYAMKDGAIFVSTRQV